MACNCLVQINAELYRERRPREIAMRQGRVGGRTDFRVVLVWQNIIGATGKPVKDPASYVKFCPFCGYEYDKPFEEKKAYK